MSYNNNMKKIFKPYPVGNIELANRLVMAPMCMYQAKNRDGMLNDFHKTHYHARALGGVGLIIVEATGVSPEGRISPYCLGLYNDEQAQKMKELVELIHQTPSKIMIQLNHAGRKAQSGDTVYYGPSPVQAYSQYELPTELTTSEIKRIIKDFKAAAKRAYVIGYDGIEIHGAHGYLIHQFLSPLSNQRKDEYGQDRTLFLKEIISAVKEVFPKEVGLRISGDEYHSQGYNIDDMTQIMKSIESQLDFVHVSSGGNVKPDLDVSVKPAYQVGLANQIKQSLSIPVIAVGLLNTYEDITGVLENNEADLVACGRELLRDPNLLYRLARDDQQLELINPAYIRAYR